MTDDEPAGAPTRRSARVESLSKHYPVRDNTMRSLASRRRVVHAVDDVSFELYAGSAVALVGESGSGKSTVGRVLAHLEPPTSGRVLFKGKQLNLKTPLGPAALPQPGAADLPGPVRFLEPGPHASPTTSPDRFASTSSSIRLRSCAPGQLALLEQVHLTPATQVIDKLPHELSGGQRQRVAIARTLAVQPSVLIADEPVSMLDVSVRLSILNLLSELVTKNDLALLYITHDIASARYFAERLLVMYAGQVLEAGPAEKITQFPAHPYAQLLVSAAPDPDSTVRGGRQKMGAPGESTEPDRSPLGLPVPPPLPEGDGDMRPGTPAPLRSRRGALGSLLALRRQGAGTACVRIRNPSRVP